MAHVALLQTDINSGFRFVPKIGMKLARKERLTQTNNQTNKINIKIVPEGKPRWTKLRKCQGIRATTYQCKV